MLERLNEACLDTDGVAPFNEATQLASRAGEQPRFFSAHPEGFAIAFGDAPVELAVYPDARQSGVGQSLVEAALAADQREFWAHGDLEPAQALAVKVGLDKARTLLVLRRPADPVEPSPGRQGEARERSEATYANGLNNTTIRTATPADYDAVVAVNAKAFADHPEQGAMDRADFDRRAGQDWFDPAGLFVAEKDGQVIGFHWTKIENDFAGSKWGEVYVVGVDPDHHGGGLGKALTARGLEHMVDAGVEAIDLYVEGDNEPALAVYRKLGFTEHARDVLYRA